MTEDKSPTTIAVLDTNVLMHFQPLRQWEWAKLVPLPVRLLVCGEVLRELDAIKDRIDSRSKSDRARRALEEAEAAADGPRTLREGVTLAVAPFHPNASAFTGGLSAEVADDRIVAVALEQKAAGHKVVFVSNDTTPRLRAKALGLEVIVPPDSVRLPEETDPRDIEIRKLTERLRTVERTRPAPRLRFAGGAESTMASAPHADFVGDQPRPPSEVLRTVQPIVAEPELKATSVTGPVAPSAASGHGLVAAMAAFEAAARMALPPPLTSVQISDYNAKVQVFRHEYLAAYSRWQKFHDDMMDIMVFSLELANTGSAPASHLEVQLRVAPDHGQRCVIVTPESLPEAPAIPKAPRKPTSGAFLLPELCLPTWEGPRADPSGTDKPRLDGSPMPVHWTVGPQAPSPRSVYYPEDGSFIRFGNEKVKHGFQEAFGPFAVRRVDPAARGCKLEYQIHADNLPEPVIGSLNLRFPERQGNP